MICKCTISLTALFISSSLAACSGCSKSTENNNDAGPDTSSSSGDGDADTDSDGDADGDSDSDTSQTGWVWEDLPAGEDCGEGCKQLTFADEVRMREWDVWNNYLVYVDDDFQLYVVDIAQNKHAKIPAIHPEWTTPDDPTITDGQGQPTIFDNKIYYNWGTSVSDPNRNEFVLAKIETEVQESIFLWEPPDGETSVPGVILYPDSSSAGIVGGGGCGDLDLFELCFFPADDPTNPQRLIEGSFGGDIRMWEDRIVFWDTRNYPEDVTGYDLATGEFVEITADDETQLEPHIYGDKVVYQDLSLGTGDVMGLWSHSALWLYDWETQTRTQITNGDWIAAYPDIYENIIVWVDYRNCSDPNNKNSINGVEIWGHNLDTSEDFQITNLPGRSKTMPRIWGNKVFVHMYLEDTGNGIFVFDLPESAKKK